MVRHHQEYIGYTPATLSSTHSMVYTWCKTMHSNAVLRKIHTGDGIKIESLEHTTTKVYDLYTLVYYSSLLNVPL